MGRLNIYNIKTDGKTASANVNVGNVFPKMLATIQECINYSVLNVDMKGTTLRLFLETSPPRMRNLYLDLK